MVKKMVKVATYFGMTFGAFLFWKTMDKGHVWIGLHRDEKEAAKRSLKELLYQEKKEKDSLA